MMHHNPKTPQKPGHYLPKTAQPPDSTTQSTRKPNNLYRFLTCDQVPHFLMKLRSLLSPPPNSYDEEGETMTEHLSADTPQSQRILIVTDSWYPTVNGVVTTIANLSNGLKALGHEILIISPTQFTTLPLLSDDSVRLSVNVAWRVPAMIDSFRPHVIHIATEGCLGYGVRAYCLWHNLPFTTAFHSKLPEFIQEHSGFPAQWTYQVLKKFHAPTQSVLVATRTLQNHLELQGYQNTQQVLFLGVDCKDAFSPSRPLRNPCFALSQRIAGMERPIFLFVGRVAVEKNIRQFLDLPLRGSKLVVGDGPLLTNFKSEYPEVQFVGTRTGDDLLLCYRSASVLVFPSRNDTFGLVLVEALSCGLPVAAFPVPGPIDVITSDKVGVLDNNLAIAAKRALNLRREDCIEFAREYCWSNAVQRFWNAQVSIVGEDYPSDHGERSVYIVLCNKLEKFTRMLYVLEESWKVILVLYGWFHLSPAISGIRNLILGTSKRKRREVNGAAQGAMPVTTMPSQAPATTSDSGYTGAVVNVQEQPTPSRFSSILESSVLCFVAVLLLLANVNHIYTIATWHHKRRCYIGRVQESSTIITCIWLTTWVLWLSTFFFLWYIKRRSNHVSEWSWGFRCAFQVVLVLSLTTVAFYSVGLIAYTPSVDRDLCLVSVDSAVPKSLPNALFWLAMDRIFNFTAHYLCGLLLLFGLYCRKSNGVPYNVRFPWVALPAFVLAVTIGLVDRYYAPVYDADILWFQGLAAVIFTLVLHECLYRIHRRWFQPSETREDGIDHLPA